MVHADGWSGLFASAFRQSRNAMVLLDERRRVVDANAAVLTMLGQRRAVLVGRPAWELVAGGPLATEAEWRVALSERRFTGSATLLRADGSEVEVQWGATTETVTGRRLVLFVVLGSSRWGVHFRRAGDGEASGSELSAREREIVRLVALGATGPEIADELHIAHNT